MNIPRVIPVLLLDGDGAFVKTVRYRERRYVGDPVNVINLFNRFEVDEIVVLDIDATREQRGPQLDLIEELAGECWVPLAYGGGIRMIDDIGAVLGRGVEKVVIGSNAADDPGLAAEAAERYGRQALVGSVDVGVVPDGYEVLVDGARRHVASDAVAYARSLEAAGFGEILLNAVDRDGTFLGYDVELIGRVAPALSIPLIACGGAASRADLPRPIEAGAAAVAAGSLFVYQGRERAVVVNFPARAELERLFAVRLAPGPSA